MKLAYVTITPGGTMRLRLLSAFVMLALLAFQAMPAMASGLANARAIGMAGSYTSLAKGFESSFFNPANLGLAANRQNGFQLIGVGLALSNNSFTLDDYNTYTGATLDQQDKDDLLSKIPAEGLKLSADIEANALAVGMGSFAFSFAAIGAAEINLGKTPMELLLNGNTIADTVDLDGMYGEGFGLASFNLSYGHLLYKNIDRQFAVGATVKYLYGLGYEEVLELNGEAATLATGFEGAGNLVSRTATGGSGYALDLGATLQLSKNYTIGVNFFNFLSTMTWDKDTKEHHYQFNFDSLTVVDFDDDNLITSEDSTFEIGSFSTTIPSTFKVGLAKTSGALKWAVDWEQGFRRAPGSSEDPRISTGAEFGLLSFLPIRAGFAVGGKHGTTYAGGFGLDFALFNIDFGAANYQAISGSAGKGLTFAINSGFRF